VIFSPKNCGAFAVVSTLGASVLDSLVSLFAQEANKDKATNGRMIFFMI